MDAKKLSLGIVKSEAPEGADQGAGLSWFVITSGVVDRDMEVLDPDGMEIERFLKNPVFLWGHDSSIPAIGTFVHLAKGTDGKWRGAVRFADGEKYPFAGLIKYLHDDGILNAVSVRFIPKEYVDGSLETDGFIRKYTKWELLETSSVNIPSNFEATQERGKEAGDKAVTEMFVKLFGGMVPGLAPVEAKSGNELSKRNRATLRSIKSRLVDCEADIDALLEKYGDEDGVEPQDDGKAKLDALAKGIEEIKTALAEQGQKAESKGEGEPKASGKDTQDEPGRREKTVSQDELKAMIREAVTERLKYQRGIVI